MKRLLILFALLFTLAGAMGLAATGYVAYDVFWGDFSHLSRERILEILSKETIVYYDDGATQVGSLFGEEHRQYVPVREIPASLKNAIVAAEDDSFYTHPGVDFVSTLRAAIVNVLFQRREGASTITQQTVKNLYGRPVTNLRAKYIEAINAFKMERIYSKDEILEFYLNQFHVTGNGRGVGVAAKYYFNKDVQDLSVVESAFIAGSVKGPELYNPFTKKSLKAREKALKKGMERKNYVIKRMVELGLLTQKDGEKAIAAKVPFSQGRFQFNQLSAIELIKGQIGRKDVLDALGAESVNQIINMGLKVTTTLNQEIQDYAQYGVRQNLSRLAVILKGFKTVPESEVEKRSFSQLIPREFYTGKVLSISQEKGKENLDVSLGLAHCTVPPDAVERIAKFIDHGRYKGIEAAKKVLFETVKAGSHVLVSVRKEIGETAGQAEPSAEVETVEGAEHSTAVRYYECDLETKPEISGGAIVIDKGEINSVVGGFSPHEYNRAVFARRQPGSTFKTLTYYAAMHLGWVALDPLVNVRDAYVWQGKFYYPRPDHPPKTLTTTVVGAGSFSENLASIWLLAHLTKKLSPSQFRELLMSLEAIDGSESDLGLASRLRDKFNVTFNPADLAEGVLDSMIDEYTQDLAIVADKELYMNLMTLNYGGPRYDKEIEHLQNRRDRSVSGPERTARLNILRNNLTRWSRLQTELERDLESFRAQIASGNSFARSQALERFKVTKSGKLAYGRLGDKYDPSTFSGLLPLFDFSAVSNDELVARIEDFLSRSSGSRSEVELSKDIWLDGYMPSLLVKEMAVTHAERLAKVAALPLADKLYWNFDLRYSAGMLFAKNMVDEMGVVSKINWVPSFPLGANDVSLAELAMSYQTLLKGETYKYFDDESLNQLSMIKRIEDSSGNLLWESKRKANNVFDSFYSSSILSVLKGTVTHGTARVAKNNLLVDGGADGAEEELKNAKLRVPAFGKTGTTNEYVNATFVGFLPYPDTTGTTELSPEHAVTIASYVGYDDNQQMRRPGVRIAGGTGALPAWVEIARAIIRQKDFKGKIDWKELIAQKFDEVPFNYGSVDKVTVPVHSSVVISASGAHGGPAGTQSRGDSDMNSFHDDYEDGNDEVITVNLPGKVEGGVFNPRVKVSFPKSRSNEFMPETIPELNIGVGTGSPTGANDDMAALDRDAQNGTSDGENAASGAGASSGAGSANSAAGNSGTFPSSSNARPGKGAPPEEGYNFLIPPPPQELEQ